MEEDGKNKKQKKTPPEEGIRRRGKNARQDEVRGETSEVPCLVTGAQNVYGYNYEDEYVLYSIPVRIHNVDKRRFSFHTD